MVFVVWDFLERDGETHIAGLAHNLSPQRIGESVKPTSGNLGEITLCELALDALEAFREVFHSAFAGFNQAIAQGLEFDGALVSDFELELAAPVDERVAGDVQFLADTGEAPSLGTQHDEALLSIDVFHRRGSYSKVSAPERSTILCEQKVAKGREAE